MSQVAACLEVSAAAALQQPFWKQTRQYTQHTIWMSPGYTGNLLLQFVDVTKLLCTPIVNTKLPKQHQYDPGCMSNLHTLLHQTCCLDASLLCRLFDMNIIVQQAGQLAQTLVFHPWQGSTPDANISAVNATASISTGGVTDNVALANSQYSLFQANTSDQGRITLHAHSF